MAGRPDKGASVTPSWRPLFAAPQWSNQPGSLARIFQIRFGNNFRQIQKLYEINTSN
jgi:hypothetical protein